jgi:peptide/nickel transport system ATP-binding protein
VPMVFQDPFSSLNPVHTIGYALGRGLALHQPKLSPSERDAAAAAALEAVGLAPARPMLARYPHELSGGQRQRVGFAQALSYNPKLVLADEPVSMLDVSIRIGVLNLMARLCAEEGISFLYITHDIASARYVSHRVVVMYAGRVAESGPAEEVLHHPVHPYTACCSRRCRTRGRRSPSPLPIRGSRRVWSTPARAAASAGAARLPSPNAPR